MDVSIIYVHCIAPEGVYHTTIQKYMQGIDLFGVLGPSETSSIRKSNKVFEERRVAARLWPQAHSWSVGGCCTQTSRWTRSQRLLRVLAHRLR